MSTSPDTGWRAPAGTINVFDPSPLNWLFITWNTMEEPIRIDQDGQTKFALAEESRWLDDHTLELKIRDGVRFQDGEPCTAHSIKDNFDHMQRWAAPHPPGTWLNFPKNSVAEAVDDHTIRFRFPGKEGLALGKMRGFHIASSAFWRDTGFGYDKFGSGEGHWWVIDRPGPWGTGPFTLVEGYSSISTRCGIMRDQPFACTWLIESEDRADNLVLEANRSHWNTARGPRLERVVFRNDLTPAEALELCCTTEGEMDIVTEISAADAQKVLDSEHAELVTCDANRVLVGIFNRYPSDVPLSDVRMRKALNLTVDFQRIIDEGLNGYANPLPALTPAWSGGYPHGIEPYAHDVAQARDLMKEADWPPGRKLRIATPEPFEGVARMVGADIEAGLGIGIDVIVVPADQILAGSRVLVEKKIVPPWDVLIHGWFDLSSEAPPAAVHREFCGADGAFRAGPEDAEFDRLFAEMASELDGGKLAGVAERIDRHVHDHALAMFLCAPKALYAVNKHVKFGPYRTTFELAETEVDDAHWSRRTGNGSGSKQTASAQPGKSSTGYSGAGC